MQVIDLHCDVLYQLSSREEQTNFQTDSTLQAGLMNLKNGNVKAQIFAIFIEETIPPNARYMEALRQIELFHAQVLAQPEMVHITDWQQLKTLKPGEIGAILSLEGCDAIGDDIVKLHQIIQAGVKLVGLTWNYENAVAHGASEDPTKGLKPFGRDVIDVLNAHDILIDVSHLNEQSFWDVLPLAKHIVASHSNARALCDHVRNLTDEQAKALVARGGHIHLVYNPPFIVEGRTEGVTIEQFVQHFKYLADLVGAHHLGLGSDFDGIYYTVEQLTNASDVRNLLDALRTVFTEEEVAGFAHKNFEQYIQAL
jgi:membrane dipeptidase